MVADKELRILRYVSTLYSGATFKRLLADENLSSVEKVLENYKEVVFKDSPENFGELLCILYKNMCRNYCNEYIFKNLVYSNLVKKYSFKSTTLHNELKIGKSIADLVLVNGEVKVFELKTELDTLSKLDLQVQDYQRVAEKINLVVSNKHIALVTKQYKSSCLGIILIDDNQKLITIKEAETDKSNFDFNTLFRLLRKKEYTEIIKEELNTTLDLPNTLLFKESENLLKSIELGKFQQLVFSKIKSRKLKEPELLMGANIPSELRFMLHSLDLNATGYESFFALLNQKV